MIHRGDHDRLEEPADALRTGPRPRIRTRTMSNIITVALLTLSILGGIANVANAANGEDFGTRTTQQQQPSPN